MSRTRSGLGYCWTAICGQWGSPSGSREGMEDMEDMEDTDDMDDMEDMPTRATHAILTVLNALGTSTGTYRT